MTEGNFLFRGAAVEATLSHAASSQEWKNNLGGRLHGKKQHFTIVRWRFSLSLKTFASNFCLTLSKIQESVFFLVFVQNSTERLINVVYCTRMWKSLSGNHTLSFPPVCGAAEQTAST